MKSLQDGLAAALDDRPHDALKLGAREVQIEMKRPRHAGGKEGQGDASCRVGGQFDLGDFGRFLEPCRRRAV